MSSRAFKALDRACKKFQVAIVEYHYLIEDCELALAKLDQDDFNAEVDYHEGDEGKARKAYAAAYKRDLKKMVRDLQALAAAATAVAEALPAVAAEQLADLERYEYTADDEPADYAEF
jgi:hypothetical protein